MIQNDKTNEGTTRGPAAEDIFRQELKEKMTALKYNELDGLGSFLRKYKPFEDGNPRVMDLMRFYDVKLEYAKDLMRRRSDAVGKAPYRESLITLEHAKTPQTVNAVYYAMKIGVGKSKDPMDSEIVLALEACRDTFNYINERSKK